MSHNHIFLLIKKNLKHELRSWPYLLLEIAVVFVLIIFLYASHQAMLDPEVDERTLKRTKIHENVVDLDSLKFFRQLMQSGRKDKNFQLIYWPELEIYHDMVEEVTQKFALNAARGFTTKQEMMRHFNGYNVLAAITFSAVSEEILYFSIHLPNKFRTIPSEKCSGSKDCFWLSRCSGTFEQKVNGNTTTPSDIYEREGFLAIQHQIFLSWLKLHHPEKYENIPAFAVNSYQHDIDGDICFQRKFYPHIWVLYNFVFFVPFLNILWKISRELEEDFLRHYSIYGFTYNQHWFAHFAVGFLHLLLLDALVIGFLLPELISSTEHISYRYAYFVACLIFYDIILLLNVFILATAVWNSKTAVFLGASIWLTSYALFSPHLKDASTMDHFTGLIWLFFPNIIFPFDILYIEESNIETIWHLLAIQVVMILLYTAVLKWLENTSTANWRIHATKEDIKQMQDVTEDFHLSFGHTTNWSHFEYGPLKGHQLLLKNVSVYKRSGGSDDNDKKQILKNINMKLFENEISIILGPRNSGKTTLIHLLAGWLNYQGHMYYEGHKEIVKHLRDYQNRLDVSLQQNALSDLLSVEEQLGYIILLKSRHFNETEHRLELSKWLLILKTFVPDKSVYVQYLTFDQKRLLSLCCQLCGDACRIVLLDEPTRHMTADGQKAYWSIMKQEKLNRVIVMTTEAVDEANAIGDRIGILHHGNLMAWATSFHLRSNLGNWVYMIVFITPTATVAEVTYLLAKHLGSVKILNHFVDRVIYKIPAASKALYQRMLIDVEKDFPRLGIRNIYMTSEELCDIYEKLTIQLDKRRKPALTNDPVNVFSMNLKAKTYNKLHQLRSALFYKKLLYQAPNYVPFTIVMFAIILMPFITHLFQHYSNAPSIDMGFYDAKKYEKYKNVEISNVYDRHFKYLQRQRYPSLITFPNDYEDYLRSDPRVFKKFAAIARQKESTPKITLWINEKILHTAAMALSLAHTLLFSDANSTDVRVYVNNEPIWIPNADDVALNYLSNLQVSQSLGIIMPLLISSFIITLMEERQKHLDILQRLAGADSSLTWWFTHFVWDYAVYWILTIVCFAGMCIYTIHDFLPLSKLVTLILLALYGVASLFLVYVIFLLAGNHKFRMFLNLYLSQIIFGLVAFFAYCQVANESAFWLYIFMLSPSFALLMGMVRVSYQNSMRASCQYLCHEISDCNESNGCFFVPQCCYAPYSQWLFPGIMPAILYLLFSAIILLAILTLTIIVQSQLKYSTTKRIKQMSSVCYPYDDAGVVDEKIRISNLSVRTCKGYAVLVDQLEYEIPKKENRVKAISFALEYSKCMGIYGPTASGKSHLIEQLIGARPIRFGEVYICGHECKRNPNQALRNLGYCPQTYGLIEGATARQMFSLYFRLNDISEAEGFRLLRDLSLALNLRLYMNSRISELPGHIKRRLNIGVALIFQNKVLIFDEPTKGLSPAEKHLTWSVIRQARDNGNAVIIASQDSMELEELADFIIMIDQGEMLAIASPHSIRKLYTVGLYIEIKLYSDGETLEKMENNLRKDIENLHRFIMFLQNNSELVMRYGNVLKYYLPLETVVYSYLFGTMEKNRKRLNIADYIITQGSLALAYDNLRNARRQKIRYEPSKLEMQD